MQDSELTINSVLTSNSAACCNKKEIKKHIIVYFSMSQHVFRASLFHFDSDLKLSPPSSFLTCPSSPSGPPLLALGAAALLFSRISTLRPLLGAGLTRHALLGPVQTLTELLGRHLPWKTNSSLLISSRHCTAPHHVRRKHHMPRINVRLNEVI